MNALSRLRTVFGAMCVVATLLLSIPGAVRVRADEQAQALSSQDPALVRLVEQSEATSADGAPAASACGQASDRTNAFAAGMKLEAQLLQLSAQAARGEQPAGGDEVIMLNGRGYNYGPGPSPGPAAVAKRGEPTQPPR